jgi:serine/threonine protein phosphatase 1
MKTFVIGDIHGGFKALIQLLRKMDLKEEDTLIFLGDYVDGWSESAQVIKFLIELSENINCIFIKGNHDSWCEEWLETNYINPVWFFHGGKEAIESYEGFSEEEKQRHLQFFKSLKFYYIDEKNRLFIHAGYTSQHGVEKEEDYKAFYFDRTLWELALTVEREKKPISDWTATRLKHYSEIYIGHTPTLNYDSSVPMNAANVWNVDTGATFYGKLSAMNIDTKEVFQSDVVSTLYPNEMGRNKI